VRDHACVDSKLGERRAAAFTVDDDAVEAG